MKTRANRSTNVKGQHSFAQIPKAEIPRSVFNRSCGVKTTFSVGDLVPIFVDEALPGDTMNLSVSTFARMATPLHPILDNLNLDLFFFAVPLRLVWSNFQKFMGEQDDPGDSTDFEVPQVDPPTGGWLAESLPDYMGVPIEVEISHSALWVRAYNLIWAEWFRSQDLQDSPVLNTDDGPDDPADYTVLKRGKRHDYFTSCMPWPQKGDPVLLPLGATAPLVGVSNIEAWDDEIPIFTQATGGNPEALEASVGQAGGYQTIITPDTAGTGELSWDATKLRADLTTGTSPGFDPYCDLSAATAATINNIREAFQVQRLFEKDARAGTRYTEVVRSHFGVSSPDQRLQRPEWLGGGSTPIVVHPIPQTSQTDTSPQGNMAAFATSAGQHRGFVKSFTEHCVIIGLASVRADLNYQQGLERMFSRTTRFDYYWPSFAHLGEQAVLNKEIFAEDEPSVPNEETFGFQERFAEYRYKPSIITGKMRSTYATSLDTWHLAQDFATLPLLNETFIVENSPMNRILATPSEPDFLFDAFFTYRSVRPMPTFSVPGLIDHF